MKKKRFQKPEPSQASPRSADVGPQNQKSEPPMFAGLNIQEVIQAAKAITQPRPQPLRKPAAQDGSCLQADGQVEKRRVQTTFGGINLAQLRPLFNSLSQSGAVMAPAASTDSCFPHPGLDLSPQTPTTVKDVIPAPPGQPMKASANPHSGRPVPLPETGLSTISTQAVVDSLLNMKRNKRAKPSTLKTYEKRFRQFEREFPRLPDKAEPIIKYLSQFDGPSGRHRRNQQDLLVMLYDHAVKRFDLRHNPMEELERTLVSLKPVRTLPLDKFKVLLAVAREPAEIGVVHLLGGHGWRQIEARRVNAGAVRAVASNLIEVQGKERRELAPVLTETVEILQELAKGLKDEEPIFVARRTRQGKRQPLGEDGMRDLVKRLYERAGIQDLAGHDLRRTFATLARKAGADDFLTMRLLRDKIPGVGHRYVQYPLDQLVEDLQKYSPLSQVKNLSGGTVQSGPLPEGEKNALPAVAQTEQPQAVISPEAKIGNGGDGGGLNSPSKRSCSELTTSLVNPLISPGQPLMTEFDRASR